MLEFDGDWDLRRGTSRPPSVVKATGSPWRLGLVFRDGAGYWYAPGYAPEDNPDSDPGTPWRLGLGLVFRVVAEDGYTPEDNPDPDPGLVFLPV